MTPVRQRSGFVCMDKRQDDPCSHGAMAARGRCVRHYERYRSRAKRDGTWVPRACGGNSAYRRVGDDLRIQLRPGRSTYSWLRELSARMHRLSQSMQEGGDYIDAVLNQIQIKAERGTMQPGKPTHKQGDRARKGSEHER